jgi:hypothetical protein
MFVGLSVAGGIVEPLSARTLKGSDSGGMMADDMNMDLRIKDSLVFSKWGNWQQL